MGKTIKGGKIAKRLSILLAALFMLSIGITGRGGSQETQQAPAQTQQQAQTDTSETEMVLKLADNQAEGYPTVVGDWDFAKRVEEKTNGRIKIEVYPGGQLGDEKSVVEAVQVEMRSEQPRPLLLIINGYSALQTSVVDGAVRPWYRAVYKGWYF